MNMCTLLEGEFLGNGMVLLELVGGLAGLFFIIIKLHFCFTHVFNMYVLLYRFPKKSDSRKADLQKKMLSVE